MKKSVALLLMIMMLGSAMPARALSPEEEKKAKYEEMKKIKEVQRQEREARKENPEAAGKQGESFWDKEGERSGLSGARMGNFFKNLNPVPFFKDQDERYKARKTAPTTVTT